MSNSEQNFYWAVEIGSYGSPATSDRAQIRCVRNLPSREVDDHYGDNALAGPIYGTMRYTANGNAIFDFGNRLPTSLSRPSDSPQYGGYSPHNEMTNDYSINLPHAFVVSKTYLNDKRLYDISTVIDGKDPCENYSEEGGHNPSDRGYWRTPNLNELMVMVTQANQLGLTGYGAGSAATLTLCRTKFSNQEVRTAFYYNGRFITAANTSQGTIRCVRDAWPNERVNE